MVETVDELRRARAALRTRRIGLAPTMGALHAGHMSLVEAARAENRFVIATIFVNPTQFEPGTDLNQYPRDLPRDLAILEAAGCDLVFTPTPEVVYPRGFQTTVTVSEVSQVLEGARRPGHFQGVATVVAKYFNLTQPKTAYFGQKDAQQVVVIRRMVRDLNMPLKIAVCPTVREPDGLAMSSRNVYLNPRQREQSAVLYRALQKAARAYEAGERNPNRLRRIARDVLEAYDGIAPEYVSLAHPRTLQELNNPTDAPMLLSLAARMGTTRLIDNVLLPPHLNTREGLTATLGV